MAIYGGASVSVSEAVATGTSLSNYTYHLTCNSSPAVDVTASLATFTMPDTDVTCTLTNTRKSHTVTLTKATVPTTDKGNFNLSIAATGITANSGSTQGTNSVTNSGGNGTVASGSVTAGLTVTLSEMGSTLANYSTTLACTSGGTAVTVSLGTNNQSGTFPMPDADVSCTLQNTRNKYNVTLTKMLVPTTDNGLFNLTISDTTNNSSNTTSAPVGNTGNVSLMVYGGASVSVSEVGANGTNLGNYTYHLTCNSTPGVDVTTSSGTFTMPDAAVSCTLTNTHNKYNVTLTKMLVPTTDSGTFNLTISDTTNNASATTPTPVGNTGSVSLMVYGHASVSVSEAAATGTTLSNYTYQLTCGSGGTLLNVTTSLGTFTMPDAAVSCTLTNSAVPANLTVMKICAPAGATTPVNAFDVSITLNGSLSAAATPTVACGSSSGPIQLNAGNYIVSEPAGTYPSGWATQANGLPNGWSAPGTFGGDCDAGGKVSLTYGQNKTCYILNVSNACTPPFPAPAATQLSGTTALTPALPTMRPANPPVARPTNQPAQNRKK